MRYLFPVVLLIMFISCKGKDDLPRGILKPDKMENVFWDYIRADIYTTNFVIKDSSKNASHENLRLQEAIFKAHDVTRETFYKSLTYYSNHKELMTKMIDSMVAKQQRQLQGSIPDSLK